MWLSFSSTFYIPLSFYCHLFDSLCTTNRFFFFFRKVPKRTKMASTAELTTNSLSLRQKGVNGSGLETSDGMSIKMIDSKRRDLQNSISGLEKRLTPLSRQREDLKFLVKSVNNWLKILHESERANSGIPVLRSVKEGCDDITPHLHNNNSEFNLVVQRLGKVNVPCFDEIQKNLKILKKEIRHVVENESTYHGKYVEDMREILGRVNGIASALLELYF